MDLADLVEDYGKVVSLRRKAESKEEEYKKKLDALGLKDGSYASSSGRFNLSVITRHNTILVPEAVKIRMKEKDFFKVVKVVKKELVKYMSAKKITECEEFVGGSKSYKVEEVE